jgi:hypothetical protein
MICDFSSTPIFLFQQGDLFPASFPFQNTIRKAYLSQSGIRTLQPGDVLLFYRSKDLRSIGKIGVLEKILVSSDSSEIDRFVGKRTVYSSDNIARMAESRTILAILFRESRSLAKPISFSELEKSGTVTGPIQSIQKVKEEQLPWIIQRITE